MKKIISVVISIGLCLTILFGAASTSYAASDNNSIQQTIVYQAVRESNRTLENATQINGNDISEISKYSKVEKKQIDSNTVDLIITNNVPEQTTYYENGAELQQYAITLLSGDYDETYTTLDVQLYVKMTYTIYTYNGYQFRQLNYGYGKLVECWESAYRNLKITNSCFGDYQNPNGTYGVSPLVSNSTTISSPTKGTLYSLASPSSNFYGVGAGSGTINVTVSIDWRHGTTWYTTSHRIPS